jgi:hypothetical protein
MALSTFRKGLGNRCSPGRRCSFKSRVLPEPKQTYSTELSALRASPVKVRGAFPYESPSDDSEASKCYADKQMCVSRR